MADRNAQPVPQAAPQATPADSKTSLSTDNASSATSAASAAAPELKDPLGVAMISFGDVGLMDMTALTCKLLQRGFTVISMDSMVRDGHVSFNCFTTHNNCTLKYTDSVWKECQSVITTFMVIGRSNAWYPHGKKS
jgi:hypothetical protein